MNQSDDLRKYADELLSAAARERSELSLTKVDVLHRLGVSDPGRHFNNLANMVANRIITLYDDCAVLLSNDRIAAACVLSRCILETYAFGEFALFEVAKHLSNDGVDKAGNTILAYVNSSRAKIEEQKRFSRGELRAEDHAFSQEALDRMTKQDAASKHILNALRHLFYEEVKANGGGESQIELLYEQLSEWTHPSQTSLFHAFAEDAWLVPTSVGLVSIWDGARMSCAQAMHFIAGVSDLLARIDVVARELTVASGAGSRLH